MSEQTLTSDEIADLRCLAGMIVPPSAKYSVPGADDHTIFADILASVGRDVGHVRGALASLRTLASAARTWSASRPMLVTMSAKIVSSSAPGTPYFALGGTIMPARQRRSAVSSLVRVCSLISASIEQGCQTLLHAVGDI